MRLGLDFDNTLISYDQLFYRVALDKGLISPDVPKQKNAVRDFMRERGIEEEWTRMQGEVYGSRILEAAPYPDMLVTLTKLANKHIPMCIVSHKTKVPYLGEPWDLHEAARGWLQKNSFHDANGLAWPQNQIFFELTKQEKIKRIIELGCTHYVDDLPEILDMLPAHIEKILFAPSLDIQARSNWKQMSSWQELPFLLGLQ
jgi:FMN phosphatase YigB (HAD superfamily)